MKSISKNPSALAWARSHAPEVGGSKTPTLNPNPSMLKSRPASMRTPKEGAVSLETLNPNIPVCLHIALHKPVAPVPWPLPDSGIAVALRCVSEAGGFGVLESRGQGLGDGQLY